MVLEYRESWAWYRPVIGVLHHPSCTHALQHRLIELCFVSNRNKSLPIMNVCCWINSVNWQCFYKVCIMNKMLTLFCKKCPVAVVPCKTTIYKTVEEFWTACWLLNKKKIKKTLSELKRNYMILAHEWKQTSENVAPVYCSVWGIILQEDF